VTPSVSPVKPFPVRHRGERKKEHHMSSNKSTRIPSMAGKAVFEAGANTETVEFSSIAELREKEDELTWKHWPTELKIVSFDYHPAVNHQTI
jgi:hypothetical protein